MRQVGEGAGAAAGLRGFPWFISSSHRALPSSLAVSITLGEKILESCHLVRFENGSNLLQSLTPDGSMPPIGLPVDGTELLTTFLKNPMEFSSL